MQTTAGHSFLIILIHVWKANEIAAISHWWFLSLPPQIIIKKTNKNKRTKTNPTQPKQRTTNEQLKIIKI